MSKRTDIKKPTPEGQILKQLRTKAGLTMIQAGKRVGVSDSYVSQIENGRSEPPKGPMLEKFLQVYGPITTKYFGELVRDYRATETDEQYISKVLPNLSEQDIKFIRQWIDMRLKESSSERSK